MSQKTLAPMPGAPEITREVARAGLGQYSPTHLHIGVVVGAETEWKSPIHPHDFNAYVERPSIGNVEAYSIVIDAPAPVVAADRSTWQGLEGIIFSGMYSAKDIDEAVTPKMGAHIDLKAERKVPVPPSLLEAAGFGQRSTVVRVPISLERALSNEDLAYVRANCLR